MDRLGPHFLLASSLRWWYLVLQRSRMSSKCFLKSSWESKVMPRNTFYFELCFFLVSMDMEKIITLIFWD